MSTNTLAGQDLACTTQQGANEETATTSIPQDLETIVARKAHRETVCAMAAETGTGTLHGNDAAAKAPC